MSIKTIARGLVVACCAALGLNAWADTIAYWHNDLKAGSSKGGWTISADSSATFESGLAKLTKVTGGSSPVGLKLDLVGDPVKTPCATVIVKYSGLDSSTSNNALIELGCGSATEAHRWLMYHTGQNKSLVAGYDGNQPNASDRTMPESGMMAVRLDGSKIQVFVTDENGALQHGNGQYSTAHGTYLRGIKIGGTQEGISMYHRPGMTIEGVAILNHVISDGDTYVFPDEHPTYATSSVATDYLTTTNTQTFVENATLNDILAGQITAKMNGSSISAGYKDQVVTAMHVKGVKEMVEEVETLTKVTMQFQLLEPDWVKAVIAECTQDDNNVIIKATKATHLGPANYGTDASTWSNDDFVATSASTRAYGAHDITFCKPYDTIKTIETSTTWADAGITAPEEGKKTLVYVEYGATIDFNNDTIPAGVIVTTKMENGGIAVKGTVPMLPTAETLTVPAGETATIAPAYTGKVIAKGTAQFTGTTDPDYLTALELVGGSLKVTGNNTSSQHIQFSKLSFSADSTIDAAVNFYSIASQYSEFNFALNGHKVTKMGTGTYHARTPKIVGGGTIEVTDGTMTLQDAKIESGVTVNVSVAEGKTLQFTGNSGNIAGTINIVSGSFSATSATLNVTVPAGKILAKETSGSVTTYSFTDIPPRTDPMTIYAIAFDCSGFKLEDGTATTMIDGDVVVFPADCGTAGQWKGDGSKLVEGHEVVVNAEMNWKSSVGTMTIGTGATVYYYEGALNEGASISGAGTLKIFYSKTLTGDVTITTAIVFADGEVYADPNVTLTLSDGATLTVSTELAEGKVLSGDATKKVVYSEGVYSLVDKTPLEIFTETINAAAEGATVQLPEEGLVGCLKIENANNITLDLNGKTITAETTATIRHEGSGTLTIKDSVGGGKVVNTANAAEMGIAVWARGGSVVIEGGVFESASLYEATVYIGAATASAKTITISGGTFRNVAEGKYHWKQTLDPIVLNVWNSMEPTAISVTGGSFSSDPAAGDDNKGGTFLASGYVSTLNEETGLYDVTEKTEPDRPADVPTEDKTEYDTWAAEQGVTGETAASLTVAFKMGVEITKTEGMTAADAVAAVEAAAEAKANEMLKDIATAEGVDLAALLAQAQEAGSDGLVVTTENANLTVKLVPATLGEGVETSAKLFKLSITIKAPSAQD